MRKILLFFSVLLLFSSTLKAQTRTVSGTVTDEKNEPIPGATIQVKGSTASTATDENGKYSINVTDMQAVVITVKFIGYGYQEHSVAANERNADFKLTPLPNDLNEVVVVGYGEQKRESLTGAVTTIKLKEVQDIPALTLSSALRGTAPGLHISGGTQRPGQGTSTLIRNPVAFAKDGPQGINPLFIIDDVVRSQQDFDLLDINEIESVSILKDAEAAIYGVQGANGVVLVRTKKGHQGAPKFSFSSSVGTSAATMLPKMMNSLQLATWVNDYYQGKLFQQLTTDVGTPVTDYYDADGFKIIGATGQPDGKPRNTAWYTPDELAYFANHSHNYLDDAFNTAYLEREALNVTGGNDKTTYFVGGDFVNQNSNFQGIHSYKYGLRANVESHPAKGLTTTVSLSDDIAYTRSYFYKLKSTSESLDNDAASLENVQPWQEYFIDGNPVLLGASTGGGYDNLNYFQVRNSNNYTGGTNYIMNILGKLNYEIPGVNGLSATITINKNINSSNSKQFGTSFDYYKYAGTGDNNHIPGGALVGKYTISNGDRVRLNPSFANSYQLDAGLNYSHSFGKSDISALVLFEQREQSTEGVNAESDGVVIGGLDYQTFTTGTQTSNQSGQASNFGFQSIISRFNYSYDHKYLLQLVYRADGSSRFAAGRNWGSFPAASVGWVVSEEPFFKQKFSFIDQLKLRASVGLTGTDNSKAYQYRANYNLGTGSSGGAVFGEGDRTIGIKPNLAIPNPEVTWDHNLKTDYGVDMQFLKNRLSVTADYFWNHDYLIISTPTSSVPATVGFQNVPTENRNIVNMFGYEISAGWRDRIGKNFTYGFTPFFSWSDDKNIKIDVASGDVGTFRDLTGKSDDAGVLGYTSDGLIRTQAQADALIAQRAAITGDKNKVLVFGDALQPGMINYVDYNNDGIIDSKDEHYITKHSSNHNELGLNFSVGYGSLNLNVIMGMSWGGWTSIDGLKPFNQSSSSTGASIADNRPVYWADHWTPTNTNAKFPAPYFTNNYQNTTNFWLVPATRFDVTSANLSYTLPNRWTSKVGIASARLYLVATNPIQFINPFPDHYRDFQTSLYSYPSLKTFSLGLNVGF